MNFRNKLAYMTLSCIFGIFVVVYFIAIPSLREIQEIREDILREKKDLELKFQSGQLMREYKKNIEKINENKNILNHFFIEKDKELNFIGELEKSAELYEISTNFELNQKNIIEKDNITILPLSITLQGDFIQTLKYLRDLEKKDFYIIIDKLQITTQSGSIGQTNTVISGKTYSKKYSPTK